MISNLICMLHEVRLMHQHTLIKIHNSVGPMNANQCK